MWGCDGPPIASISSAQAGIQGGCLIRRSQAIKFTSRWNIFTEVTNVTKVQVKASLKSTYQQETLSEIY